MQLCLECGKPFDNESKAGRKYCSLECFGNARRRKQEKECSFCGETFLGSVDRKYCSRDCAGKGRSRRAYKGRVTVTCCFCGEDFSSIKSRNAQFCSRECANEAKVKEKSLKTCVGCGGVFIADRSKRLYCSLKCFHTSRPKARVRRICQKCGKLFELKAAHRHKRKHFCSRECYHASQKKVKWPSKEQLAHLLEEVSVRKIAEMYGVQSNAVRYWAKKYGLELKDQRSRWSAQQAVERRKRKSRRQQRSDPLGRPEAKRDRVYFVSEAQKLGMELSTEDYDRLVLRYGVRKTRELLYERLVDFETEESDEGVGEEIVEHDAWSRTQT